MIQRVLFKRSSDSISYVGKMLRSEVPTVICGACGKGVAFPVINQICSANCGAYVYEILAENVKLGDGPRTLPELQEQWFNEYWVLYPRKVAKASALKAWKKAATSEAIKDAIMAGLKAQLGAWGILDPATMKYVPHAATWLNQERWNDEPEGGLRPGGQPRMIECNKCGDTGVYQVPGHVPIAMYFVRCSCPRGQLPDLMVGTFSLETGELISNETPQDGVI